MSQRITASLPRRSPLGIRLWRSRSLLLTYGALALLFIVGSITSHGVFLSGYNLSNLMQQATALSFVAIAQSLVVLTGGIDLSVGALVGLVNVVIASIASPDLGSIAIGVGASLTVAVVAGLLNGAFIVFGRLQPIVVTLATSAIYVGLALLIMPIPGGSIPGSLYQFVTGHIGPFPVSFLLILTAFALVSWLLMHTPFGWHVYSIGGNEEVARSLGVRISRTKIILYGIAGLLTGMGGLFLAAQMGSGDPLVGSSFVLDSIAAVAVGGVSLLGGKGSLWGVLAGTLIIAMINNVLNLSGVASFYQYILKGLILLITLAIASRVFLQRRS